MLRTKFQLPPKTEYANTVYTLNWCNAYAFRRLEKERAKREVWRVNEKTGNRIAPRKNPKLVDLPNVLSDILCQASQLIATHKEKMGHRKGFEPLDLRLAICSAARYYANGRRFERIGEVRKTGEVRIQETPTSQLPPSMFPQRDVDGNKVADPLELLLPPVMMFHEPKLGNWEPYPAKELLLELSTPCEVTGLSIVNPQHVALVIHLANGLPQHEALTLSGYNHDSHRLCAVARKSVGESPPFLYWDLCRFLRKAFTHTMGYETKIHQTIPLMFACETESNAPYCDDSFLYVVDYGDAELEAKRKAQQTYRDEYETTPQYNVSLEVRSEQVTAFCDAMSERNEALTSQLVALTKRMRQLQQRIQQLAKNGYLVQATVKRGARKGQLTIDYKGTLKNAISAARGETHLSLLALQSQFTQTGQMIRRVKNELSDDALSVLRQQEQLARLAMAELDRLTFTVDIDNTPTMRDVLSGDPICSDPPLWVVPSEYAVERERYLRAIAESNRVIILPCPQGRDGQNIATPTIVLDSTLGDTSHFGRCYRELTTRVSTSA